MDVTNFWWQSASAAPSAIGNALRFRGAQYLSRTPAAAGNQKTWTVSAWVKRGKLGAITRLFGSYLDANKFFEANFDANSALTWYHYIHPGYTYNRATSPVFRDCSAWMHLVFTFDSTNGTAADRMKMHVNGQQITAFSAEVDPPPNFDCLWNSTSRQVIGDLLYNNAPGASFDGYMAELHSIDGSALDPTSFGEFNADGVWVPKKVSGLTYGTNGFYLDFSDAADIGADRSGNGNNFTATGFELTTTTSFLYDLVKDSPTDNYSTLNPLIPKAAQGPLFYTGNLGSGVVGSSSTWIESVSTVKLTGKKYIEGWCRTTGGGLSRVIGIDASPSSLKYPGKSADSYGYVDTALFYNNAASVPYGATYTDGDYIGLAFDSDALTLEFFKNGASQGAKTVAPGEYFFSLGHYNANWNVNFGQLPLIHTPPAGFEPLSIAELPAVAITNPSDHFRTLLSNNMPVPAAPAIGSAYKGGFYGGRIKDGSKVYDLIVAPATDGSLQGQTPTALSYRLPAQADTPSATYKNEVYGAGATAGAIGAGTHPLFDWCTSDANGPNAGTYDPTNAAGTGIGGFNDWYIPAKYEMEILYRNLKPTTGANGTSAGTNVYAVPPTGAYTASDPAQTSVADFQSGGAQAFPAESLYTATEYSTGTIAWKVYFVSGLHITSDVKSTAYKSRAIRREFAYDAGLLEYAQATFPNGLWWIKDRANSNQHQLVDSLRGNTAMRMPDLQVQPYAAPAGNSVAWCWTAPDTFTSSDGTIPTSGRRNLDAGFSMFTYTANNTAGSTVGHGLNKAPEFVVVKNSDRAAQMVVAHVGNNFGTGRLFLDSNTGNSNAYAGPYWDSKIPTDTVISLGSDPLVNYQTRPYIIYCWHSVPGYSSIGSYVGNGSDDGPFVYTGFRIGFLLLKRTDSTSDWMLRDTSRAAYNPVDTELYADLTNPESTTAGAPMDFLSNGFKLRGAGYNSSGSTWIYIAIAEFPFGGSNVSPATAR